MNRWHQMTVEDAIASAGSDAQRGLSEQEASLRLKNGKNRPFVRKKAGLWERILRRSFFLPLVMLISGIALFISGDTVAGYVIVFSLLLHLMLLFAAEFRAVKVMEEAEEASAPAVKVIRDGRLLVIPGEDLVRGDVILLFAGDHIPADCRLLYTSCFTVLERGITPKERVTKEANAPGSRVYEESHAMIFAGCVVEEGFARALVCETGTSTLLATTKMPKEETPLEKTPFLGKLRRLSSFVSLGLLGLITLVTILSVFPLGLFEFPHDWTLVSVLAAGAMSEFYPAFALITAGNGVFGALALEKKVTEGAVIRRSGALPSLAAVDQLILPPSLFCVEDSLRVARLVLPDKTVIPLASDATGKGTVLFPDTTLEEGTSFSGDAAGNGGASFSGHAAGKTGASFSGSVPENRAFSGGNSSFPQENTPLLPPGARFLLRNVLFAMTPAFSSSAALRPEDPVLTKKKTLLAALEPLSHGPRQKGERTYLSLGGGVTPGGLSYGLVAHEEEFFLSLSGPAESVIAHCGFALDGKKILPLDAGGRSALLAFSGKDSDRPTQTMAVAYGAVKDSTRILETPPASDRELWDFFAHEPVFDGFVVFEEVLSPRAMASLSDARDAGIALALSADSAYDRSVAYLLGFGDDSLYYANTMEAGLSDPEALFVSLTRREKAALIDGYQANGKTVAYLGKDFSHIACMKRADVAISVGRTLAPGARMEIPVAAKPGESPAERERRHLPDSACDAIRQGADVIVAPASPEGQGGFYALTEALLRARALFYNTRDILRYLTFTLAFRLVLTFVTVFSDIPLVTPMALTLYGLGVDLLAVAVLALRRPQGRALFTFQADRWGREWLFPLWGLMAGGAVSLLFLLPVPTLSLSPFPLSAEILGVGVLALLTALMGRGCRHLFAYRGMAGALFLGLGIFFFVKGLSFIDLGILLAFFLLVFLGTILVLRFSQKGKKPKAPEKEGKNREEK